MPLEKQGMSHSNPLSPHNAEMLLLRHTEANVRSLGRAVELQRNERVISWYGCQNTPTLKSGGARDIFMSIALSCLSFLVDLSQVTSSFIIEMVSRPTIGWKILRY